MPSITIWNRIEPRCRTNDQTPGLEARVHDPLWLLARQWQIGEFEGRDAGSPVNATVQTSVAPFDRFSIPGQKTQSYNGLQPIEALVEREVARPPFGESDLRQAAEAGLYLLRLLQAAHLPSAITDAFRQQYPLSAGSSPASDVAALGPVLAGRIIDGVKLHQALVAAGVNLPSGLAIPQGQQSTVMKITRQWIQWYDALFAEPVAESSWSAGRMEYTFAVAAAGDSGSYMAQEYDGSSIDWYTFNRATAGLAGSTGQPTVSEQAVIATPVTFRGMPARRYWELEDGRTNIGVISAAAEDVGRLLLREFALIYGSDWFQFPLVTNVGSQVLIKSLTVADTFGITAAIPQYSAIDGASGSWRMFSVSADAPETGINSSAAVVMPELLLMPAAVAPLNSSAVEEVLLLRDELADAVWGIEQTVLGASGLPLDRTLEWRIKAPVPSSPTGEPMLHYRLGSTVPDYWIPFLPVQIDAAGHLQLRRARLPNAATQPLGNLLAEEPSIFLEEVPREGVRLERRYRSARATDGSSHLWIGRRRTTGRGEGRSGLRFDYIE
jgi:hypothetical protein